MSNENEETMNYSQLPFQASDLEVYDNLSELRSIAIGLKNDLTPDYLHPPNPDLIIPVCVAGASLGSKTTVLSQLWEEFSRDPLIQGLKEKHGVVQRYYFLDTGMVRELGAHLGIIKHEQGDLTLTDYQGLSDLTEELVPLGLQYLTGPGQLGLEFVWVTAIFNKEGEMMGTPRGSLRLAQRLAANANGRFIVLTTPEDLKDQMEDNREKARLGTPAQVKQIADAAGNIHSIQDPEQIHAYYMLSSNKATRIQQAHDVGTGIWAVLKDQQEKFSAFENFQGYYFDPITEAVSKKRYPDWEQLVSRHHKKWLEQIFHKPLTQIDASRGAVIDDTPLLQQEAHSKTLTLKPRHLYDSRLMKASLYRALIAAADESGASASLQAAVKRLELRELKIYSLT
ncbi:hypothetical protein HYT74_02075 [Candidatus Daviesbacteria bacterium]|nr:hypothetical protein [Candidatus Daviesbacteria bacterium]